jgi:predicted ATPase/DNA-binding SARP family transcriptional activator
MDAPEPAGAGSALSISLLGPVWASRGAAGAVVLRTQKEWALLAYLAVEAGHPHTRETLAELLWPERPPGVGGASLRQALTGLRHAIGDCYLLTTRQTVQFNTAAPYWLDVHAFSAHLWATRTHTHQDLAACGICMGHLQQAAALYRGDFLASIAVGDSLAFEDWAVLQREWLFRHQIEALERLADYWQSLGDLERARLHARRWVELDPLSERAHRQLMALLALSGRRREALLEYEASCRVLRAELGVEPRSETKAMYEKIRTGKLAPPVSGSPVSPASNLPQPLTPFIGREHELAYVTRLLLKPDCRMLTLVGPGGVGKTRLAVQAAETSRGQDLFPDGVWFIPLETIPSPDHLPAGVAQALGVTIAGKKGPGASLLAYLKGRTALLVIDGFEHLLSRDGNKGVDLLLEILQAAPGVKILITSRERLRCQAEFLLALEGLPCPTPGAEASALGPEQLRAFGAVQLFLERAGRASAGIGATDEPLPCVARICQLVEGLPLGIELAAARLEADLPAAGQCAQIAQEIQEHLEALSAPMCDLPPRQRSIRAVCEDSFGQLARPPQAVFGRLSVFRGSFSAAAARAVAGEPAGDGDLPLEELVDKSLVRRGAGAGRYSLHALLRQYAAEKLAQDPLGEAEARARHARFYLEFLQQEGSRLLGPASESALSAIRVEIANVRAAWDLAVQHCWVPELAASLSGLAGYYGLVGLYREGDAVFGSAARRFLSEDPLPRPTDGPAARHLAAYLLLERAHCLYQLGQLEAARSEALAALQIVREIQDRVGEAKAQSILGNVLFAQGAYREAMLQLASALSQLQAGSLPEEPAREGIEANLLSTLGNCHDHLRDWQSAHACFEQALACAVRAGNHRAQAMVLNNLGTLYARESGDLGRARECFQKALLASPVKDNIALGNLATAHLKLGEYAEARACYERAIRIRREIGARQSELWPLGNLGLLHHYLGDDESACDCIQQALRLAQETGDRLAEGVMWLKLGHALAGLGRLEQAAQAYRRSAALLEELSQAIPAGESLVALACLTLSLGDAAQAQRLIEGVVGHLCAGGSVDEMLSPFQARLGCYHVLVVNGDPRARGILEAAHRDLQQQAARIADRKLRRSFLERVAAHRDLVQTFERMREAK